MSVLPQPSNRIIREQFSEGTTIDSDRIQGALDTVEDRINEIPRGDILPRYVEQTVHLGFLPGSLTTPSDFYPWGPLYNSSNWVTAAGLSNVENELRVKGCYNSNIASPSTGDQYVWSTGIHHTSPCLLTEVHFNAVTDAYHVNALTDNVMHIIVSVDSDSGGNDRHLNSFEVAKHLISDPAWRFRRTAATAVPDMLPAHTDDLGGNIVSFQNLKVTIPAGAKVRYQVVIPRNVGAWGANPFSTIVAGLTLHYLEEVVE